MITFFPQAADAAKVGPEHGLSLSKVFEEYRETMHQCITQLYATQNEAGGWKKWLALGDNPGLVKELQAYAQQHAGQFTDMVILGIGGSSLGGYALLRALVHPYWNNLSAEKRQGRPRYHFIENVDSDQIAGLMDILEPKTTLITVITKSGTTAETMSAFMTFKAWLEEDLGTETARQNIVAITDANKGILRDLTQKEQYVTFPVPDDVGGRFSVFSAVGLFPAVMCGIDIEALLQGVRDMAEVTRNPELQENPAAQNALIQYLMYGKGKNISVFMPYSYVLAPVSDWYVQLWAESLGKKEDLQGRVVNVGPTPVRAVGVTDQHSQVQLFNEGPNDKVLTFIEVEKPQYMVRIPKSFPDVEDLSYLGGKFFQDLMLAELDSTRSSLTRNGRPHVSIRLPEVDAYHVGQLLYLLEVQTALAGDLFGIDPFNQPGVELAKVYTYALMGRKGYEHLVAEAEGEVPAGVSSGA